MIHAPIGRAASVILALGIAGCVPVRYDYLEPTAPDAQAEECRCAPPLNCISFTPPGLDIRAQISARLPQGSPSNQLLVDLTIDKHFNHKPGSPGMDEHRKRFWNEWEPHHVVISSEGSTVVFEWPGHRIEQPLEFPGSKLMPQVWSFNIYHREWSIPSFSGDRFTITLPPLEFDGVRMVVPPVTFTRKSAIFATPINC